ncbi:MAG: serine hydroxymethyltransferase [Desulfarculales bacterium]|jgi:glycine hydroxymethyltransferase|nr:serine hydroxymethyltransferase [Desulfarculales bacterium]
MKNLAQVDAEINDLIEQEARRQATVVRLIASENYASAAVMRATGSCLTNKYSEGYAYQRYYQGQEFIDRIEEIAVNRLKALFGAEHVNVQPYSGSPANQAVYMAVLKPGDRVMGMDLSAGGHLTHGAKVSFSGKLYEVFSYGLDRKSGLLDYEQIRVLARQCRPRMIIAGGSAYPRTVDFAAFRSIADEVGAVLMADISHFSGLCLSGDHPHPLPHAHIVTTTTHKLLRGPRGGVIMSNREWAGAIDKAVFPGLQGGPHNHVTAAIAVAAKEATAPEYIEYCHQVVKNARTLAQGLLGGGFNLISGGTDTHLILLDASSKNLTGKKLAVAMEKAGLVANANKIPFDPRPANDPSGVRLGTPAVTSRGMKEPQMTRLAEFIKQIAEDADNQSLLSAIKKQVESLCQGFPAPGL